MNKTALIWLRQDLRLKDRPAPHFCMFNSLVVEKKIDVEGVNIIKWCLQYAVNLHAPYNLITDHAKASIEALYLLNIKSKGSA